MGAVSPMNFHQILSRFKRVTYCVCRYYPFIALSTQYFISGWLKIFLCETDYNISSEQHTQEHDKNQCDKEESEESCS